MNADTVIETLNTQLKQLCEFARTHLAQTGDTSETCQLVGILIRAQALETLINGISERDLKEQMPERRIVADLLADADRAYSSSGDGRLAEALPDGVRGDRLADFIASEIRHVMKGSRSTEPAVTAITDAADTLKNVAEALDLHIPY